MGSEKNNPELSWTHHAKEKMKFYGFSEARLKRVLRRPDRVEKGIAPGTVALMQKTGTKRRPTEIWLMYEPLEKRKTPYLARKKRIVTAWRYPAISPIREEIPIPEDIKRTLLSAMAKT